MVSTPLPLLNRYVSLPAPPSAYRCRLRRQEYRLRHRQTTYHCQCLPKGYRCRHRQTGCRLHCLHPSRHCRRCVSQIIAAIIAVQVSFIPEPVRLSFDAVPYTLVAICLKLRCSQYASVGKAEPVCPVRFAVEPALHDQCIRRAFDIDAQVVAVFHQLKVSCGYTAPNSMVSVTVALSDA